jgi:branched-chain amino acid transport system ATP-binding protein
MESEHLLVLDGLSKSFGRVVAAENLNLTVRAGEALGIVGPNGAGKSTLFNVISGDLAPNHGTIVFDGNDVTRQNPYKRTRAGMGRTYQVPRPFDHMTVFENVLVSVHQGAGLTGREAWGRADEVLQRTGLIEQVNLPAGRLALLQRKRLEVARAWATDPKLLLLDEVAGGLTTPEVSELVELVKQVHQSGVAIVWIEHVVQALTSTVDRLLCLAGGRIVADGNPAEVMVDPEVRELYLGGSLETELDAGTDGAAASDTDSEGEQS